MQTVPPFPDFSGLAILQAEGYPLVVPTFNPRAILFHLTDAQKVTSRVNADASSVRRCPVSPAISAHSHSLAVELRFKRSN